MAKFPPRDNNVDLTRSTMQRKINSLLKQVRLHSEAANRKNSKLSRHNHLINKLISESKLTRQEVKEFLKYKHESNS